MRKLLPYLMLALLVCGGFAGDQQKNATPVAREFKMSECLGECRQERVRFRSFFNHILTLQLDIMANCADKEIEVRKFSGDTLYLNLQPALSKSYHIDDATGDTFRIRQGVFCDCFFNIDITLDSVTSDPQYIRIKNYLIQDTLMKKYDKIGRLGEIKRQE